MIISIIMLFNTSGKAQMMCHLTFDNGSLNGFSGKGAHAKTNGCSFTTDRFGNPNSALHIDNKAWLQGPSTNFPLGNSARTISAWIEMDANNMSNAGVIFGYGACPSGSAYGMMLAKSCGGGYCGLKIFSFGYGNDLTVPYTAALNSWVHLAATYDGSNVSIYVDGVLKSTSVRNWNTTAAAGIYAIGNSTPYSPPYANCQTLTNFFIGNIDDLRFFGKALSSQEIVDLYNAQSTVGVDEKKSENFSFYPNPAMNEITISGIKNIQSVKITDITGKLVKEVNAEELIHNKINIEELNQGVYLVNIIDENNNILSKKLSVIK